MKKICILLLFLAAFSCKKDNPPKPPNPPDDRPVLSFSPAAVLPGAPVTIISLSDTVRFTSDNIVDVLMDSISCLNSVILIDSAHLKVWQIPNVPVGTVHVTVRLKTKTIRSSDLTVLERAKWAAKTRPDSSIYNAVSFSIGSKGYVLTGSDSTFSYAIYGNEPLTIIGHARARFLEYDPAADSWKRLPDFPGGNRVAAAGFSIGTKAYIGTGSDWRGNYFADLWSYDTQTGVWQQLPDLPAEARYYAVGFSVGGKGYIGTGMGSSHTLLGDIWEFDPAGNSWKKMADFPGGPRYGAIGIGSGTNGYIGLGDADPGFFLGSGTQVNDLWQFTPGSNTWVKKAERRDASMNQSSSGRKAAAGFALNGKIYLGMGYYYVNGVPAYYGSADLWKYDPAGDSWQVMNLIPYDGYGSFSFVIGSQAFIGGGADIWQRESHSAKSFSYNSFYQFTRLP